MRSALRLSERAAGLLRLGVLLLALVLTGAGLMRQEQTEVLQKAVRICLECIGIG